MNLNIIFHIYRTEKLILSIFHIREKVLIFYFSERLEFWFPKFDYLNC